MRQLIAFEFRKLVRSKAIYICMIVMAVLHIASVLIAKSTMDLMTSMAGDIYGLDSEMFAYSGLKYLISACSGANMTIFFGIFVTIFVCSDFTEGTIKNIVARGFNREKIFFAKSIAISTGSIVFGLASMLVSFVCGTIAFGAGKGFNFDMVLQILVQLLALVAYTMLNVLLGVLFGKLGGALTLGIIIPIVSPLIFQLLDLCIVLLAKDASTATQDFFSRFTVSTNLGNISSIGVPGKDVAFAAVIFGVYICLFSLLGVLAIRKKEV